MRPIEEIDFGLWPTPRAVDGDKGSRTPEGCAKEMARKGRLDDLPSTVTHGLWPTPAARDSFPPHTPEYIAAKKAQGHGMSNLSDIGPLGMVPALLQTPVADDAVDRVKGKANSRGEPKLSGQVVAIGAALSSLRTATRMETAPSARLTTPTAVAPDPRKTGLSTMSATESFTPALWSTASARDWKDSPGMATVGQNPDGSIRFRTDQLPRQAALYQHGAAQNGQSAQTGKPGALNPEFVCWLMGFPPEWDACAPTAMPSSRKSRQK
jgi:hypothetical protein